MEGATVLADDPTVIQRVLDHIDNKSTDQTFIRPIRIEEAQ